jgi:hypothetical protein
MRNLDTGYYALPLTLRLAELGRHHVGYHEFIF